jgi:glycosyltransferase involved in cell wall biosynthesis
MGASIAISVIIPCYDSALWLRETVASVLAQTRQDLEIILVDDGSKDATACVIGELVARAKLTPIIALSQTNAGTAAARNLGITRARGHYILPLDADDLLHPAMLAECAAALDARPKISLAYTDRQDFGDSTGRWRAGRFELARLRRFNQLAYCSLYRRSLWERVGGYRTNVTGFDDWDFWVAAAAAGAKAHYLPQPYLLHRRHRTSQLWNLLPDYEMLYSRIILNNPAAYTASEQAIARDFLDRGTPAALLQASRFLFLAQYYPGGSREASCVS